MVALWIDDRGGHIMKCREPGEVDFEVLSGDGYTCVGMM